MWEIRLEAGHFPPESSGARRCATAEPLEPQDLESFMTSEHKHARGKYGV